MARKSSTDEIDAHVGFLHGQTKVLLEQREAYGKNGFQNAELTDSLLKQAKNGERLANALERLVS